VFTLLYTTTQQTIIAYGGPDTGRNPNGGFSPVPLFYRETFPTRSAAKNGQD
jgi:hypothetical protein